jgi:hypothetical protein
VSRSKNNNHTSKGGRAGWDGYWGPRPEGLHGYGKRVKTLCHKIERRIIEPKEIEFALKAEEL